MGTSYDQVLATEVAFALPRVPDINVGVFAKVLSTEAAFALPRVPDINVGVFEMGVREFSPVPSCGTALRAMSLASDSFEVAEEAPGMLNLLLFVDVAVISPCVTTSPSAESVPSAKTLRYESHL